MENVGAIVTGSSRGIGRATAIRLAQDGFNITVNYSQDEEGAEKTVRSVRDHGGEAFAVQADVSEQNNVERMVERTLEEYGELGVLVNNAGFSHHATLDELEDEDWQKALDVNLNGAFYCAKAAAPKMKDLGWGRIVNISSLRAMTGSDHGSHYASSKAGILGLTKSLALELAPEITVNAISPGYTRTPMNREAFEKKEDQIAEKIPLDRVAESPEIAGVVSFLVSHDGSYVTGETINANGGIYMTS
ncbi:3-oxoacyl-ACP reductase FabG [Candidatus Bipolaricaulota bacterium]|nr:3-oxoacyl-ACP reductase FabG [Candidatus Bipolaricaulota bacterium]